jgi:hypothetical protein
MEEAALVDGLDAEGEALVGELREDGNFLTLVLCQKVR